ncbi:MULTISPECIES: GLUG motif-containing protein [Burkholderia]|uniref:Filamentous hemagglutinin family protein n=2 Tax=Burkholderia TaxID=32008 RepID=A0A318IU68_BURPY|nr:MULTISPECIES: GLUG motif-containing protein [Burkholderia]PXX38150.1 filamentous hemagglutinin family protein [Burkholderia pyrrocinia]SFW53301.1 filamentous hemagglutinin family N-terminal domain-containing protein [Burkholderia sp. NFACC33-1]SFX58554.1 filamentous hemagglutinin family N-terminal domain-containing protein [Burkholderia sp. NFPP32]
MNKAYSLVWNEAQGGWCAVGETARRRGKKSGGKRLLAAGVSLLGLAAASGAYALPTGGEIASGKADIATSADGKAMSINQHTDKLITNWQDFSVGGGERVSFQQPTNQSIALNRVIGANGSQIQGQLDANGRVFLVNPNGVMFGAGAQVNVGGLVASTQNLSDADFLAGRYRFAGTSGQSVENAGTITAADGGSVALLGARVSNTGVIRAQMGRVVLGAGNAFNVNFDGNGLLNLQVEGGAVDAQAHNGGLLKADGGEVLMTARAAGDLLGSVVKNSGTIEAKGLSSRAGKITLDGGEVQVGGMLDASAQDASTAGGTVTTRGERVAVSRDAQVDTRAASGRTGLWTIEAANAGVGGNADVAIDGEMLSRNLGTTNVALTNTSGDLRVSDAVTWASENALALTSKKGNVDVNQSLTASGAKAGVTMNAAQQIRVGNKVKLTGENASLALNAGSGHTLTNDDAVVTLSGRNASFSANGEAYDVIHDLAGLRGVDGNMNGRYVLGNAIDGKGAQFRSLGGGGAFGGVFDGLGNTISRLAVNGNGQYVGLFGMNRGRIANLALDSLTVSGPSNRTTASVGALAGANHDGTISNVRATNTTISSTGNFGSLVGGLVGDNVAGVIDGARFQGTIAGNDTADSIGGIAGRNAFGARITNSRADVSITGLRSSHIMRDIGGLVGTNLYATVSDSTSAGKISVGDRAHVGGLVGRTLGGVIDNAVSTVDVSAGKSSFVGGAVGLSDHGTIRGSSAHGIVSATNGSTVGGFVGLNRGGQVERSQAYGEVNTKVAAATGGFAGENIDGGVLEDVAANGRVSDIAGGVVGGLVGRNAGMIRRGKAAGDASVGDAGRAGGLVAVNDGTIEQSTSGGTVHAGSESRVGGLVGLNRGTISGSGATGSVTAAHGSYAGGLVGENTGAVRDSKASGNVTALGGLFVGGFAGWNGHGALIADSESSGTVTTAASYAAGFAGVNYGAIRSSQTSSMLNYQGALSAAMRGGFVAFNAGNIDSSKTTGAAAREAFAGINFGRIDGSR